MEARRIGILGGSGLYEMPDLEGQEEVEVETPFGRPSDRYTLARLAGRDVAFLPRHGKGHRILPGELNFRANIYGFKKLGADWIIGVSAVGSMREDIKPLDVVLPDQFIDRTHGRTDTFFGGGAAAHISFADPVCPVLCSVLAEATRQCGVDPKVGGTYVCIEGPAFSTRAESALYRSWGVSVIGMTNVQEAKLAREAEICYSSVSLVTDYDCWHESEEEVSVAMLISNVLKNSALAQRIIAKAVPAIPQERSCICASALQHSVITAPRRIPPEMKKKLDIIIGKYIQ